MSNEFAIFGVLTAVGLATVVMLVVLGTHAL
jgi:hypothetical protein